MSSPVRALLLAAALSTLGLVIHNVEEFGASILLRPETVGPVAVTAILAVALVRRPGRSAVTLLGVWGLMHLLLGGPSVLPLPFMPFVPEQTWSHYAAHAVYIATQIPLLALCWRHRSGSSLEVETGQG